MSDSIFWRVLALAVAILTGLLVITYGVATYMSEDPYFMAIMLVVIVAGPILAFNIGSSRGHTTEKETWERIMSYFDAPRARPVAKQELPRAIVVNGARIASNVVDYKRIVSDMITHGYPTFTRGSLRDAGAYIGANENYTEVTHWLLESKLLNRTMKDNAEVYAWTQTREELRKWWAVEDFERIFGA